MSSAQYRTVRLEKLRRHPWVRLAPDALFLVPTEFLATIAYQTPSSHTDLGEGDLGTLPTDEVWNRILHEGMNDPLYIIFSVPRNRSDMSATIRLESGNHRIRAALDTGFTHLPVVGFMQTYPRFHLGNGDHAYPFDRELIDDWCRAGGRDPKLYEPYPHPVDLCAVLKDAMSMPVAPVTSINVVRKDGEAIWFDLNG